MPTVLVTGSAGFIGSCFVRAAIRENQFDVVSLDKLTYAGNLDNLAEVMDHPRHQFVEGDIRDRGLIESLLAKFRPQAIVHFAAESHVDRSIDEPAAFIETNVFGTFNLLDAAKKHWQSLPPAENAAFRFLHVSTDEVYGSLGAQGRFSESSPYRPNSPYAASKASSDHFVRAYYHTFGLPTLITNCSNNYGPFQFPEKLIPLIIMNCLEGKKLPVYGDGQQIRDWLYVEDHCAALRTVLAKGRPGEVYNIGGDCEMANLSVVQTLCDVIDELRPDLPHAPCRSLITFVQDRPGHDRRYAVDAEKTKTELGWKPAETFVTGIRRTAQWYLANSAWTERVTSGGYRRERLGLNTTGAKSS